MEKQSKGGLGKKLLFGAALALVAGAASAQTAVDVSDATDAFTGVATAVNSIGPLMLAAAGAGIVYKWVTAFLL